MKESSSKQNASEEESSDINLSRRDVVKGILFGAASVAAGKTLSGFAEAGEVSNESPEENMSEMGPERKERFKKLLAQVAGYKALSYEVNVHNSLTGFNKLNEHMAHSILGLEEPIADRMKKSDAVKHAQEQSVDGSMIASRLSLLRNRGPADPLAALDYEYGALREIPKEFALSDVIQVSRFEASVEEQSDGGTHLILYDWFNAQDPVLFDETIHYEDRVIREDDLKKIEDALVGAFPGLLLCQKRIDDLAPARATLPEKPLFEIIANGAALDAGQRGRVQRLLAGEVNPTKILRISAARVDTEKSGLEESGAAKLIDLDIRWGPLRDSGFKAIRVNGRVDAITINFQTRLLEKDDAKKMINGEPSREEYTDKFGNVIEKKLYARSDGKNVEIELVIHPKTGESGEINLDFTRFKLPEISGLIYGD
jgi:hypothetical protein